MVSGIEVKLKESMDSICEPCIAGKQHCVSVPRVALHRSSKPLDIEACDLIEALAIEACDLIEALAIEACA